MDSTAYLLATAHDLHARAGGMGGGTGTRPGYYKIVGLVLAISSGVFIGTSFVIKKHGLLQANKKYNEEAGEGYGYLKNAWWWLGMTLMILGEVCNLVAYAFTDAILVTPMGALSVVICAILSTIFLKERLSFVGKVGCFNCIIGSVVIAVNAPEQSSVARIQDMKKWVLAPGFLSYAGVIIVACIVIALWLGPKYGKKTMMVYITICSLIGGLSVVATQGLGAAVVAQASGTYGGQFKEWFLYVLLVFVVITLLTEIIYLNVSFLFLFYFFKKSAENANHCPESLEFVQRRFGNSNVLRLLHLCNNCHFCRPFSRLQRHPTSDCHCHYGIPPDLLWCRTATAVQVGQGCTRRCCVQGRSRSSANCC